MFTKEQLQNDLAEAMRAGEQRRRDVLRLLLAAIKQEEVDGGHPLSEEEVQRVMAKQAKQRRETIADAERAGRQEMAAREQDELEIIEGYLPEMMDRDDIRAAATQVIDDMEVAGIQDMGRVMGRLMPQLQGKAEGHVVSDVVRQLLAER